MHEYLINNGLDFDFLHFHLTPRYFQQPYAYYVTGQLQELMDLTRPATVKAVYNILYSPEASLLQA